MHRSADRIAAALRRRLESGGETALPSVARLAAEYRVSVATVREAARALRDQGIVEFHQGRRIHRSGSPALPAPPKKSSAEALYDDLVAGIRRGTHRTGRPLPKVEFFTVGRHAAVRTVLSAYRRLVGEGMAYRRGKQTIVGRPSCTRRTSLSPRVNSPPVVVIVTPRIAVWEGICSAPRTAQFGDAFIREAEAMGVHLLVVQESGPNPDVLALDSGDIAAHLRRLCVPYLGAMMVGTAGEFSDLGGWVRVLSGLARPVVWFDRYDDGRSDRLTPRHIVRCHFSEEAGIEAALDFLHERGHGKVAYRYVRTHQWQAGRLALLARCAADRFPQMELIALSDFVEEDWRAPERSGLLAALETVYPMRLPQVSSVIDRVAREDPKAFPGRSRLLADPDLDARYGGVIAASLAAFGGETTGVAAQVVSSRIYGAVNFARIIADTTITALISACDRQARGHRRELAGIGFPRGLRPRISHISFDNEFRHTYYPLSTVDFGFGHLGYQAFHAIFGDIPIMRDRKGDIAALAAVVDRGSVELVNHGTPRATRRAP